MGATLRAFRAQSAASQRNQSSVAACAATSPARRAPTTTPFAEVAGTPTMRTRGISSSSSRRKRRRRRGRTTERTPRSSSKQRPLSRERIIKCSLCDWQIKKCLSSLKHFVFFTFVEILRVVRRSPARARFHVRFGLCFSSLPIIYRLARHPISGTARFSLLSFLFNPSHLLENPIRCGRSNHHGQSARET